MAFSDLLQHTCSLYRPYNTGPDASGGTNITWTGIRSAIPCLIRGLSGGEQTAWAQRNIVVTHSIYGLNDEAQTGDKVTDADGASYILTSIQIQRGVGNIDTFYFWMGRELLPGE